MFASEDDFEELIETNKHITGKTVEMFTGGDSEIVWNLNIGTGTIDDWAKNKSGRCSNTSTRISDTRTMKIKR